MEPERSRRPAPRRSAADHIHMLVDSVLDQGMFALDARGHVLSWNQGAQQLDGYSAPEVVGRHCAMFFTDDDVAAGRPQRGLDEASRSGRHQETGWRQRRDGRRYWAQLSITALRDANGQLVGYGNVVRDLGDRFVDADVLRRALDNAIDAVLVIDDAGTVRSFSKAAERMFGHGSDAVLGRNVAMLMPEPERSRHDDHLQRYLQTGQRHVIGIGREVVCRRADGSDFPAELAVSEFFVGDRRHFLGVVRDVSDKKRMEAQVRQAQKMDAFGRLASGIAHDFNNLLTVVMGNAELVLEGLPADHAGREVVRSIQDAGRRAVALTRRLLTFSRRSDVRPQVLALNDVVAEAEAMLRRMIGEHVVLSSRLDPDAGNVRVDKEQMHQVLINLALNARDAMPDGGSLTMRTIPVELQTPRQAGDPPLPPGRYVLLSVSDTGHGISQKARPRIFEPFFTTREPGKGTGLGLTIVLDIVDQSGGYIEVDSVPGAGATFWIYLPVVAEEAAAAEPPVAPRSVRGSEHVLLVEDDAAVRQVAERALARLGYRVSVAGDGEQALQLAGEAGEIDLLVTDVVLPPKLGSRELVERLRAARPQLRVLFVSGYDQEVVVQHGGKQAGVAFLAKPFAPHELAARVRDLLDAGRMS